MENYLTQITNYLLAQSWQIAVLVVVIAAASWLLKNKSAHVRYLLWLIVLAKCLVPPLLTVPLAILPQERLVEPAPILPAKLPAATIERVNTVITEPPIPISTPVAKERATRLTVHQWLGLGWVVGVAVFAVFAVIKALRTNFWLWRQRKPLATKLQSEIEDLFGGFDLKTFPKIWSLEGIGQPFVWGLLRGSIYLPADFVKVDNAEHRKGVLGHELSHILRFDAAINILQIIAQAVFWFHPFVWWANKKIRAEREKCCDEMAIASLGAEVKDYSSAIVNILISEHESTRPVPSLAVAGPVKNIEERIKTMLRPGKKFYKSPSLIAALAVLLAAGLTVPTALVLTARAETGAATELERKATKSLERAAIFGDIDQVRLNLSLGADVNAKGRHGRTALHYAASRGYTKIARVLIAQGADVNAKNEGGRTPLHFAAEKHNVEMIELLIAKGADVNAKDDDGMTPVSVAMASRGAGREVVDLLVSKGADIPALHLAAYRGELRKVQQNLDEHRNVDSRDNSGRTALHYAAGAGHRDVVEFLITRGAEVNAKAENSATPLHCAAKAGWINVAELLIAKGADVNARDRSRATALHVAAWAGHGDLAKLLIAKGTDVTAKDWYGYVPLHAAAWTGLAEVTELLVAKGNDPDANDIWGITPLHHAVENDRTHKVAKILIAKGANVNAKDKWGFTPLHCAVWHAWMYGNKVSGVVTLLLESVAEVNARDNSDWTPLCYTADYGQKELAELLLAKGADVNVKTKDSKTPLSLAKEKGHKEIVELLRKHGAKE